MSSQHQNRRELGTFDHLATTTTTTTSASHDLALSLKPLPPDVCSSTGTTSFFFPLCKCDQHKHLNANRFASPTTANFFISHTQTNRRARLFVRRRARHKPQSRPRKKNHDEIVCYYASVARSRWDSRGLCFSSIIFLHYYYHYYSCDCCSPSAASSCRTLATAPPSSIIASRRGKWYDSHS